MIKARGVYEDEQGERPLVLLGLTPENVRRLMADRPIRIELADLGLPPMQVLIIGDKDQATMARYLAKVGLMTAEAAEAMALAEARMEVDPDAPREVRWKNE